MRKWTSAALIASVASVASMTSMANGGQTNTRFHYYYFKEKRPLALDLQRIAVLQTDPADRESFRQGLARSGMVQAIHQPSGNNG